MNPMVGAIQFPFSLSLTANILFLLAIVITLICGATLYYHWIRYGVGILGTITVMVAYAVGTILLLLMALGLLSQI